MKSDAEIRDDVIDELRWDPQIPEPDAIGVAVTDGAVTLTGHVATYAQKQAAARAAERVEGVKAVANEIKVELAGMGRDDADIATAIARILDWDVQIPEGTVHARVENGWVILAGEVGYDFQRGEVDRMVRQVRGVTGVTNAITINPPASPASVRAAIEDALRRPGRGGRAPDQGRGFRPHREALRTRALDEGGERGQVRGCGGAGRRQRGEPPRGYPLMPG